MRGVGLGATAVEREPKVPAILKTIQASLNELYAMLSQLETRLEPVRSPRLRPVTDEPRSPTQGPPDSDPRLVDSLKSIRDQVDTATARIQQLMGDLEV